MNARRASVLAAGWARWHRRVLPAYAIFLFCATHLPNLQFAGPVRWWNKVLHVVAFGLLAFLSWQFAETFRRPLPWHLVLIAAGVLFAYSAVDEYTQQFTGRDTDFRDWLADVASISIVLAALAVRGWMRRRGPRA